MSKLLTVVGILMRKKKENAKLKIISVRNQLNDVHVSFFEL